MKLPPKKLRILLAIPLLGRLVAKKIRSELGLDACKLFGSGTAPIAPAVLKWYRRIGINISEGWGMTETAGLSCVNWPYNSQAIGTIGQALPGTMMRTNADGEIEIKSPGLFSGYHMQDNLSDSQMTDDGYFKTGDKGKWDNLVGGWRITGRVKDLFKTAKGKYVTPVPIEARLAANDLIEQVCVMGSGLPQPIAVVVLSEVSRSVNRAQIKVSLETTMNNVNLALENHERVSNILIAAEEWTPENNLLTPTLKIKRDLLESKYLNSIEKDFDQTVQWE